VKPCWICGNDGVVFVAEENEWFCAYCLKLWKDDLENLVHEDKQESNEVSLEEMREVEDVNNDEEEQT